MDWLKGHQGHRNHIPRSERQGLQLAQAKLFPLQAQIAVMFGRASGDLDGLRDGMEKLLKKEPIRCDSCLSDIFTEGHEEGCKIVAAFQEVMTTAPGKQT